MEHGHAHPTLLPSSVLLANGDYDRQQTPHRALSLLGLHHPSPNSSSSSLRRSPQTIFETPLSLPQKRLQLRNAGFRAARIPSHRLSTKISRWFSDKDLNNGERQRITALNGENSPSTVQRQNPRSGQTSSGILQEITSSNKSRRAKQIPYVEIAEDNQDDYSPTLSWYHDAPSRQQSPNTLCPSQNHGSEMKLREISGNAQRSPPPLSSPLARQVRGRSKRGLNLRKTSFPASEHIVFLETKLEEVERSQYSPRTGLPLKDKVKALATENIRLQEMLAELEHQFDARLKEAVEHKTGLEMSLRRRIKQLEEDLGSKDCTIQDLQHQNDASQRDLSNFEAYKVAVERLEIEKRGMEETNRSLEKRNDVLTELLGKSPTRSHHGFELPSPVRDRSKRTPRPRSMMPRIPTSPARAATDRPLSLHNNVRPMALQHEYSSPLSALNAESEHPCRGDHVDPQKFADDSQSVDSGLGESCSVRLGNDTFSHRSSMPADATAGLAAWGLPLPPSPTEEMKDRSGRQRTTRRFASGSTQLKPLVLPTLNGGNSLPQSAPLPDTLSDLGRRDMSQRSIDPTIAFLSQACFSPSPSRGRSDTWAAGDALRTLEGPSNHLPIRPPGGSTDGERFELMSESAFLASECLPEEPAYDLDPTRFSLGFVDEVIMEEESPAFVGDQVEETGNQSFSSEKGEVAMEASDYEKSV